MIETLVWIFVCWMWTAFICVIGYVLGAKIRSANAARDAYDAGFSAGQTYQRLLERAVNESRPGFPKTQSKGKGDDRV